MNLRKKIMIIFFIISILPLLMVSFYSYHRYTHLSNRQIEQVSQNLMDIISTHTLETIDTMNSILEMLYMPNTDHMALIDDLDKYASPSASFQPADVLTSNELMKYSFQTFVYNNDSINGVFIFTPSSLVLGGGYGNNVQIPNMYDPSSESWYQNTLQHKGNTYISGPETKSFFFGGSDSISFSTALYDTYDRTFLGVLLVDCSPDIFDLSSVNPLPDIARLMVQNDTSVLYTNADTQSSNFIKENTLYYETTIPMDHLKLSAYIDKELLYQEFGITKTTLILVFASCAVLVIIAALILSRSIAKPIMRLSAIMLQSQKNPDLSELPHFSQNDEIGILYRSYQEMLDERDQYVKNSLENKLILLDSQMKSLESQINAHFLYNTLESINSIATLEKVPSIATMALSLGRMFRYSIKTESELVPLSDEVRHTTDYTTIQEIRFHHKYTLITDVPVELRSLKVLKLILQPMVENALYHGLNYCKTGDTIWLTAAVLDQQLILSITDNGVGIPPEDLQKIRLQLEETPEFTELGQRKGGSIGIKNVYTRIRLYYGEPYGLKVDSRVGEGTTIRIILPVLA